MSHITNTMVKAKTQDDDLNKALKELNISNEWRMAIDQIDDDNYEKVLKILINKCSDNDVCIITTSINNPHSDIFEYDEKTKTFSLLYHGQKVESKFDSFLQNPNLEKHLLIKRGSKKRYPLDVRKVYGDWEDQDEIFYGGKIINIVPEKERDIDQTIPHPESIFRIYVDYEAKTKSVPYIDRYINMFNSSKYRIKMKTLFKNGWIPTNKKFDEGIIMCKSYFSLSK